jgi:hypothetical protein
MLLNTPFLKDIVAKQKAAQEKAAKAGEKEQIKRGRERVKQIAEIEREFGDIADRVGEKGINVNFTETPQYKMVSGGKKKKWKGKKTRNPARKVQVGKTYGYDFERQGPSVQLNNQTTPSPRALNAQAAGLSSTGMTGTSSETPINTMSGDYNNRQNLSDAASVGMTGTSSETPINQGLSSAAEGNMNLGDSQSLADRAKKAMTRSDALMGMVR